MLDFSQFTSTSNVFLWPISKLHFNISIKERVGFSIKIFTRNQITTPRGNKKMRSVSKVSYTRFDCPAFLSRHYIWWAGKISIRNCTKSKSKNLFSIKSLAQIVTIDFCLLKTGRKNTSNVHSKGKWCCKWCRRMKIKIRVKTEYKKERNERHPDLSMST